MCYQKLYFLPRLYTQKQFIWNKAYPPQILYLLLFLCYEAHITMLPKRKHLFKPQRF